MHQFYIKLQIKRTLTSVWFFPAILTLVLIALSGLAISGSSIGIYDILGQEKNNNLISGEPRTVRSDEWLVTTPMTFSQIKSGYPVINQDIGDGQDMAVALDVPYKEWSILFKPQNLGFFVLSAGVAFALKWWLMAYVLMLGVYFLFISLFSRKIPAILLAVYCLFNPFVQWWYQSITLLTIGYALLITAIAIQLLKTNSIKLRIIFSILIYYLMTCFAILMYPAFQVPTVIIVFALFMAWYLANYEWRYIFEYKRWVYLLTPVIAAVITTAVFLYSHIDAVKAIANTVYPGMRYVSSGGESIDNILSWPFSYLLLDNRYTSTFGTNQSGASHFFLFGLFCLPILVYGLSIRRTQIRGLSSNKIKLVKYIAIAMISVTIFFLVRLYVSHTDFLFNILGLSSVPHERLRIGIGLIIIIGIGLAVCGLGDSRSLLIKTHVLNTFGISIVYTALILAANGHYQLTSVGGKELVVMILLLTMITSLLIHPRYNIRIIGLSLALVFALFSTSNVNPLYKGSSTLFSGTLVNQISVEEKKNDSNWIVDDYFAIENLPLAAGAEVFGGTYSYPQKEVWEKYFPGQDDVINRYSHIQFIIQDEKATTLTLRQADNTIVNTSSCSSLLRDAHVDYIVSTKLNEPYKCFDKLGTSPQDSPFVIYKRTTYQ